MSATRPVTVLIGALGGEGGGVLTDWIVTAAAACDLPVQSTSIPGVAQRTGATTYYIEIYPKPWRELDGKRPVLALAPGIGDIDMVVASELLEGGRAIAGGFVTPDRTLVIASTHRSLAIAEKIAMADGRVDTAKLVGSVKQNARAHLLFDMETTAKSAGAMINAVMLGAIAASGRLPIPAHAFESAIQAGKSSGANLRGFEAGLEAARRGTAMPADDAAAKRRRAGTATLAGLEGEAARFGAAAEIVTEGLRRLAAYQNVAYARLYLDRLAPIAEVDAQGKADGRLTREVARHLALRMSYEDVIRVAQAKIAPERMRRITQEVGAKPGEPVAVVEFLKPGIEEMCSILPPWMARPILALAQRRGWLDTVHWGMEIRTTSVSGYLRFRLLASLRGLRPRSYRFAQEQAAIEAWLGLIRRAAAKSEALAREIAACAGLVKGYGDTWKRGAANYATIEERVIRPTLAGAIPVARGVDAVASARAAALADPDGETLAKCLAEIAQAREMGIAAE